MIVSENFVVALLVASTLGLLFWFLIVPALSVGYSLPFVVQLVFALALGNGFAVLMSFGYRFLSELGG